REAAAHFERETMIETVADCGELFKLCARWVGAQIVDGGERHIERGRRVDAVEIEDANGHARLDDAHNGVRIGGIERRDGKAHKLACGRNVVERARARVVAEVGEVAREQIRSKIVEARWNARSIRVELAPEMRGAIKRVVGLKDEAVHKLA